MKNCSTTVYRPSGCPMYARADDNTLLDLADHLPVEAAEALLELATGGTPPLPSHASPKTGSYAFAVAPSRYSTGGLSQVPIPPPPETGSDTDWEAPLGFSTGGLPQIPSHTPPETDPFEHPDARRRFRVIHDVEELERALDYPWEKWVVFLHPAQRDLVERTYNGPARVSGSAGTGKTIVALHRAVHLARTNPDARVLLTTFSETLANALRSKLRI